jgi:hypothetical protein
MAEFSKEQESAIEEKIKLFSPILEDGISKEEYLRRVKGIESKIARKRLDWFYKNKHKPELDFLEDPWLDDMSKALALLYHSYMDVPFNEVSWPRHTPDDAILDDVFYPLTSRNFCPYLEAFRRMNISPEESVRLCKFALEKPCQALINMVNPDITFLRDYSHIRPVANDYCSEILIKKDFRRNVKKEWDFDIVGACVDIKEPVEIKREVQLYLF